MSVNEKMTAIAESIRGFTGKADKLTLDDMVQEIDSVYETGHEAGYEKGVTDGKQAECDAFWDAFQTIVFPDGTRIERFEYPYAFCDANDEWYNPKNRIYIGGNSAIPGSPNAFYLAVIESTKVPIVITHAACSYFFRDSAIKTIPDISITVSDYSPTFNQIFMNATQLTDITFTSEIKVPINFQWSPLLSTDSLANIIEMLHDFVADGSGITRRLSLGSTNIAKLTAEQLDVIEQKGWTYA